MLLQLPTLKIIQQVLPRSLSKPVTGSCRLYNGGHAAGNQASAALVLPCFQSMEFCHTTCGFSILLPTVHVCSSPCYLTDPVIRDLFLSRSPPLFYNRSSVRRFRGAACTAPLMGQIGLALPFSIIFKRACSLFIHFSASWHNENPAGTAL